MLLQYVLSKQNNLIHRQKPQFQVSCVGMKRVGGDVVNMEVILAFPNMILYVSPFIIKTMNGFAVMSFSVCPLHPNRDW